jgi:Polyketide cyclase / dehydrase and lipid transport
MLKKILIGIVLILAVFAIIVALQPSEYSVTRSATMAAAPAAVFDQVNDFQKWQAWSPWEKIDPEMQRTFEGPGAGTGAVYSWAGNSDVGERTMTITESRPSELVRLKLEFREPMASTADTEFTFKPEGEQTTVTWNMSGKNNFIGKAFCLFMNMDKMIGGQFEEGLANLKTVVEREPS